VEFASSIIVIDGDRTLPKEVSMDITTLLIIVLIVLVLTGGFYGRGRWY
jgi:hypothetical protein